MFGWRIGVLAVASAMIFNSAIAARLPRSQAAKAEFKRLNPCPATGQNHGACPGWEIDHIKPLKCQGADRPSNMQWLTIAKHKKKTRRQARRCLKSRPVTNLMSPH